LTVLSFDSVDVLESRSSSQLNSLAICKDNSLEYGNLLFIYIQEVRSTLGDQPCLSSYSSFAFSVNKVLSCLDLESFIMLDDHALLDCCDLLLNSGDIGARAIDKPLVSWESVLLAIFEVSDAFNSESRVMRNCSVRLVLLLKNLVDLQRERLWPLLVSSNLKLAESDLWLAERSHDDLTLLVPNGWVSNDAVVSWGVVDHLDRTVDYLLVIFEDEELEACIELRGVGVEVLYMYVLVCGDFYVLAAHKYLY